MVVVGDCLVLQRTASLPMSGSGWSWAASLEGRGAVVVGREGDILMLSTADGEMVRQTDETTVAVLWEGRLLRWPHSARAVWDQGRQHGRHRRLPDPNPTAAQG